MPKRRLPYSFPVPLPPAFIQQMEQLLGEEASLFFTALQCPVIEGLRINPLKIADKLCLKNLPVKLLPVSWCSTGFRFQSLSSLEYQPGKHPYHVAGLYYLQEPSAMAVVEILAPQPGERILDLCAAPGGKTTHIAAMMKNQGILVANEINIRRVKELEENLDRWGAQNVVITNETPERLANLFGAYFDRVLVDAPCSGEGMFRKSMSARMDWSPAFVQGCSLRQSGILNSARSLVRPGGWLVYSTCTFNPQENEQVIARFIHENYDDERGSFEIIQAPVYPGFSSGRPDWAPAFECNLERTVRIWPHNTDSEGHYIALMQKKPVIPGKNLPLYKATSPGKIF